MSDISMGARRNRSVSSPPTRAGTVAAVVLALTLVGAGPVMAGDGDGYRIEAPSQSEVVVGVHYASGRRAPGRASNPYAVCTFELHQQSEVAGYLVDSQRWGGEFVEVGAYERDRFESSPTWWSGVCPLDSRTRFASGRRATVWVPGEVVPVEIGALVEHAIDSISIGPAQVRTAPSGRSDQPFLTNLPVGFTFLPAPVATVSGTASAGPLVITATGSLEAATFRGGGRRVRCAPPFPSLDELVHRFVPPCSLTFIEPGAVSVTADLRYRLSFSCSTPCDLTDAPAALTATSGVDGSVAQASGIRN